MHVYSLKIWKLRTAKKVNFDSKRISFRMMIGIRALLSTISPVCMLVMRGAILCFEARGHFLGTGHSTRIALLARFPFSAVVLGGVRYFLLIQDSILVVGGLIKWKFNIFAAADAQWLILGLEWIALTPIVRGWPNNIPGSSKKFKFASVGVGTWKVFNYAKRRHKCEETISSG